MPRVTLDSADDQEEDVPDRTFLVAVPVEHVLVPTRNLPGTLVVFSTLLSDFVGIILLTSILGDHPSVLRWMKETMWMRRSFP